jgi:uncharacterized membrane protein
VPGPTVPAPREPPRTRPPTAQRPTPRPGRASSGRHTLGGLALGVGLGGFLDGIVLHQILQWHHLLTAQDRHAAFPDATVRSLEENTLWDGLFHAVAWLFVVLGVWLLAGAGRIGGGRRLGGLLLAGWGGFNLVEGVVDHHLLGIHHVRDDVADPLWWDLGFLALGAVLVVVGVALWRSAARRAPAHRAGTVPGRLHAAGGDPGRPASRAARRWAGAPRSAWRPRAA